MKKLFAVLLVPVLLAMLMLSSCADTSKSETSSTPPAETASAEPAQTSTPSTAGESSPDAEGQADSEEVTFAQMNVNEILFGGDVDEFFSAYKNTDTALDALQPILFSALFAAYDSTELFFVDDDPVDAEFEWTAVYHLINDFEFERKDIAQDGGNLIVTQEVMSGFFMDEFAVNTIPAVPDSLNGLITFDASTGTYTLLSAGIGGLNFVLDNISLSKASSAADPTRSASIRFDIQDNDGNTMKMICVEIVSAPDSTFKYSVMDAYTIDQADDMPSVAVPNPMQQSSAKEIVDTLGYNFYLPDGAEDAVYFIIDSGEPKMAQVEFTLDGTEYTSRIQSAAAFTDISGMYYDWTSIESVSVSYCDGEVRYIAGQQGICLWYDVVPGLMYSVSVETGATKDMLLSMADSLFVPAQDAP